jgi:hypothetical protein
MLNKILSIGFFYCIHLNGLEAQKLPLVFITSLNGDSSLVSKMYDSLQTPLIVIDGDLYSIPSDCIRNSLGFGEGTSQRNQGEGTGERENGNGSTDRNGGSGSTDRNGGSGSTDRNQEEGSTERTGGGGNSQRDQDGGSTGRTGGQGTSERNEGEGGSSRTGGNGTTPAKVVKAFSANCRAGARGKLVLYLEGLSGNHTMALYYNHAYLNPVNYKIDIH